MSSRSSFNLPRVVQRGPVLQPEGTVVQGYTGKATGPAVAATAKQRREDEKYRALKRSRGKRGG